MGEVVKRRESLILAWKVRGVGVESHQIIVVGTKNQYIRLTWVFQPQHCRQFGADKFLLGAVLGM